MDKMFQDFLEFLIKEKTDEVEDEKNELESAMEEGYDRIAHLHKNFYDAHIKAGFTDEQALELVKTLLISGGRYNG